MNRWTVVLAATLTLVLIAVGCSGGGGSPVSPGTEPATTNGAPTTCSEALGGQYQTHLWGYWDVYIDVEKQTAEAVFKRSLMFTANVVKFLNTPPTNLGFKINDTSIAPDYFDVDIDVTITHPFPGYHEYDGYDVRGVFMGDGSGTLSYNTDLDCPVLGVDQYMLDDPANGDGGGPDGYTRWFNLTEFSIGGMPMFQYTKGVYASPGFAGTATLCPYKYFADGLGVKQNLWEFLTGTGDDGIFSAGAKNTRNYYLRFPNAKGVVYGYAVTANWEGVEPDCHPSNAPEAVACMVDDDSTVWYVDPTQNGGDLILDISLFGWQHQPAKILIESTVLGSPHEFTVAEMTPIGGGEHYSTYHVEIPADNVTGNEGQEFWVIAQYDDFDYKNDFGVPNLAGDDPLAALFRYDLAVGGGSAPWIQVIIPNGGEVWQVGSDEEITWTSEGVAGTVFIEYSKDNFIADIHAIASDESNDGSFLWEDIPNDPSDTVRVRVSSTSDPDINDISDADFSIVNLFGWARTWGGDDNDRGFGVAVDGSGNAYVTGQFRDSVDFDPGAGTDWHTSNGDYDIFLSKFDSNGEFLWAHTWGAAYYDQGDGVAVDSSGNVYAVGWFYYTVDFDPGAGTESYSSNGAQDVFLSKFNSSGTFQWARAWGGIDTDYGRGVCVDGSGNIYATGSFYDTVDFDPGAGTENHSSNGSGDVFLSKFDPSGTFVWARTWGGVSGEQGRGSAVDGSGNVYVAGWFAGTADFDPGAGTDNHSSNGMQDVFLSKLDSSGGFHWARTWGGALYDEGRGTAVDGSGNIYVAGWFADTVDFNPGPGTDNHTSNGVGDSFLSRFDPSGTFQWARTWGTTSFEYCYGVAADSSGNGCVTGMFWGTVDFDPGAWTDNHSSNGKYDAYLSKFDSSGAHQWARTWGGAENDQGHGVAADGYGNVHTTGKFGGTVDFAPSDPPCNEDPDEHTSNGQEDAFLTKHLSDGCW